MTCRQAAFLSTLLLHGCYVVLHPQVSHYISSSIVATACVPLLGFYFLTTLMLQVIRRSAEISPLMDRELNTEKVSFLSPFLNQ